MQNYENKTLDINITELIKTIFSNKITVLSFITLFVAISFSISFFIKDKYTSTALIKLSDQGDSSSFSSLSSQYGGIASLAGLSLPSSGENQEEYVIEFIKSKDFLKHLLSFEDVKINLFAIKSFDKKTKSVEYDPSIYDSKSKKWVRDIKGMQAVEPSYIEVHKLYLEDINIYKDRQSNFIQIEYTNISPYFAKSFIDLILSELNEILRQRDLNESTKAVNYLAQEQLKAKTLAVNEAIANLMEEQFKTQMLSNLLEDYKVENIDPAFIPEEPSSPNRLLLIIMGALLGFFVSIIYILINIKSKQ